MGSAGLHRAQG